MRLGIDVRIDPHGNRGPGAQTQGDGIEKLKLGFGLDIETGNRFLEGCRHLAGGLADAGKNDLAAGNAKGQSTAQLTFRNDVDPGSEIGKGLDHGLVGIGLDRIENGMFEAVKGLVEDTVVTFQGGGRVAVERGAYLVGKLRKIDLFGMQHAVSIGEMVHRAAPVKTA